ncbi:MAG TPA: HAD-IA family hydrolase [Kofleriaceae bacterium]|nr:HAD-IA family hydrolase [Kofleriaceae bacterium]
MEARAVKLADVLDRYEAVLLDAFGVLVDGTSALQGAAELVAELDRRRMRYLVVTNDASRLPETASARFRGFGLDIEAADILTSGQLIAPYMAERDLAGARCLVLGTDDSQRYVSDAGGVVCPIDAGAEVDLVAVCDDEGYPFLEAVNATVSVLFRAFDAGRPPHLCLPNPDLVFPAGGGRFGFTSGAVALLFEAALARRYAGRRIEFDRLGKPHRPLFDAAAARLGTRDILMIGDQLETDIAGARRAGLDAALLVTGVSRWQPGAASGDDGPTWLLDRLW